MALEVPPPLSAKNRSSFAYTTIKDRLPVILVKIIDFMHRKRGELDSYRSLNRMNTLDLIPYVDPESTPSDTMELISQLARLRKELETNKELECFSKLSIPDEISYFNEDIEDWNDSLRNHSAPPTWFESPWLVAECYLYRKLKQIFLSTSSLKMFDPFIESKQEACRSYLLQMDAIASYLADIDKTIKESPTKSHPSERNEFSLFLQLALWANKCDLSITGMDTEKLQAKRLTNLKESVNSIRENILCDNTSETWFKIQSIKNNVQSRTDGSSPDCPIYIDLVSDNAGYELFVDLCLIHFLSLMFCKDATNDSLKFRIHVKRMPWFVSDATSRDLLWLISYLEEQTPALQQLAKIWRNNLAKKFWLIEAHKYWTLPFDYSEMKKVSSDLYKELSQSSFIIFKGDLNYRKLTGDRAWHLLTPFKAALRGFEPAPLLALRTAKADVVVGIEDINIYAKINNNELPRDWMVSGNFGLIQFTDPL